MRWRAHNPTDLAENLRGLKLWLRTGNGQPGGPFGGGDNIDITELGVAAQAFTLHRACEELRIPHLFEDYGPGHHLWPYWNRGLRQTLPAIMARLKQSARPPARVTFTAAEPSYAVYGWTRAGEAAGDGVQPAGEREPARLQAVRQRHRDGDHGAPVHARAGATGSSSRAARAPPRAGR